MNRCLFYLSWCIGQIALTKRIIISSRSHVSRRVLVIPLLSFIELYIISTQPHARLTQPKNKKPPRKRPHRLSGVKRTLPRIDISDHELLQVQGPFRHQLPLNSIIDSILRTVYHASAPARPAWRPAQNHTYLLFPRPLRCCQLEATELSVPTVLHILRYSPTHVCRWSPTPSARHQSIRQVWSRRQEEILLLHAEVVAGPDRDGCALHVERGRIAITSAPPSSLTKDQA